MEKRNESLDVAKGIGICMVVFGHIAIGNQPWRVLVFSFHMPLFLIISGYCFTVTSAGTVLKKMVKRYLVIAYATLIFDIALQFVLYGKANPFPDGVQWLKTFSLYRGLWLNVPIWYLFTMTLCQILCLWCTAFSLRIIPVLVGGMILLDESVSFPIRWWGLATLFAFPFFAAGFLLRQTGFSNKLPMRRHVGLLIISFLVAVYSNGFTDIYAMNKGRSYLLFLYTGLVGTYLLIRLSRWIVQKWALSKHFFSLLGQNMFWILITHYYICRHLIPGALRYTNHVSWGENIVFQVFASGGIIATYYVVLLVYQKRLDVHKSYVIQK